MMQLTKTAQLKQHYANHNLNEAQPVNLGRAAHIVLSMVLACVALGCGTVKRETEPEFQGTVPIGDYEYVVNMDYCDDAWIMTLAKQVSVVTGPGQHTSLYGMVSNVLDAHVVRDADTLYVGSPREGVLRSVNQGITFAPIPGLDTMGKVRKIVMYGGELVVIRQKGLPLRTVRRSTWKQLDTVTGLIDVVRVGTRLVFVRSDGSLLQMDSDWNVSQIAATMMNPSQRLSASWDNTEAVVLSGKTLYRFVDGPQGVRVDTNALPQDREWREVSVLGDDIVLLAGKNEVWWGSFDEPMQIQSILEGDNDKRIVSMELSDIGLVVGFRGTEQSVFLNLRNSNTWEPMFRAGGQAVNDVVWMSRSNGTVFVGTRDGGLYQLSSERRNLLDIASPHNEISILGVHGSYPNKLMTIFDGRVLHATSCRAEPTLIRPPVPFAAGQRVLFASEEGWFVHDATNGLFVSRNGGSEWKTIAVPDSLGYLEMLVNVKRDLYAYGSRRLLHSADDGQSWASVFPSDDTVYSAKRYGDELLVISHKGWSFVRGARIYDRITPPAKIEDSRVFVFDAKDDIIALLTESALYVSNDRGKRWGSLNMSRESMFPYVRIANDRVFAPLPGTGLMMFDVYSDRPGTPSNP